MKRTAKQRAEIKQRADELKSALQFAGFALSEIADEFGNISASHLTVTNLANGNVFEAHSLVSAFIRHGLSDVASIVAICVREAQEAKG